jgi:hypothetical protein
MPTHCMGFIHKGYCYAIVVFVLYQLTKGHLGASLRRKRTHI